MRKFWLFLIVLASFESWVFAQDNFYKQFTGKWQGKTIRLELIKAPDRDNVGFNLRGSYYLPALKNGSMVAVKGNMTAKGNVYLEEGYFQEEKNKPKPTFIKTGNFSGIFNPKTGKLEGNWKSTNGKQTSSCNLFEDYSNGAVSAAIIFNDVNFEDAEIRFHYPEFKNHVFALKINQYVQDSLLGNTTNQIHQFMNQYQETRELGGLADGFESSNIIYITHNDNQFLTLDYSTASYTGGAHGIYGHLFKVFNLKNGKVLQLEDIFNAGFEKNLTQIIEQALRAEYQIPAFKSLAEFGFTLPNGKFYTTRNFYLNRFGIGFYYNVYEIAPYSIGSQDIFVPYAKIKQLIRKESGLVKYF
jgi:hypothetical protein